MKTDRYGLTARDELALDAAKLYHSGLTQQQVADQLFVNRATVSKLLATAQQKGLVRTEVLDPRELDTHTRDRISQKYGLASVRAVAPVGRGPTDVRRAVGHAAAQVLASLVQDGDAIGIWWSRTTAELALASEPCGVHGINIVDLNHHGARSVLAPLYERARTTLAHSFRAHVHVMDAPLIFPTLQAKLNAELTPELRAALHAQRTCRIAVFGTSSALALAKAFSPLIPAADLHTIASTASGHVCGRIIDSNGRICAPITNQRTTGLSLPDLRSIEQKVLVAGGEGKTEAIAAILANRYANHLVTDAKTADRLLS